ncbi:MAG: ABC transporter substrate-binding protein [Acidimicrobiales bacterium]
MGNSHAGQRAPGRTGPGHRYRYLALLAALFLVAAACGSDDGDDSATDSGSETGSETGGDAPTGEPIKVMVEAPIDSQILPYPNIPETARVYAEWINDQGGIQGRPLEIIVCDDRADAGEAANCARTAVSEGVVANVGGFTLDVGQAIPIYEENSIAWFGACCPLRDQEFKSPISFPLGFVNSFNPAAAIRMIEDGCESIVGVFGDDTANVPQIESYTNGFKSIGADVSDLRIVLVPVAPGDYSAQAAQINDPPADCVFGQLGQVNWPPLISAMEGVGATPRYYGPQGNLDSTIVEQFPESTEGAVVIGVYPNIGAPVWDDFRAALETYEADPELNYNSLAGLGTWTAFTVFTIVVDTIDGEIDNETFLAAANQMDSIDTGGMVGIIDFTSEYTGGGGELPRIFNRTVFFDHVVDGELVPLDDGQAYDMSDSYDGKPSS